LWRSWRSFRLPTRRWACSPPLRLTSIPLNVPLTEASAQLQDNRPSREVKSIIEGAGVAGIPEAGLIVLPLVLAAAGLPDQVIIAAIPLIMTVDWIIARARSGVSDMLVAILLDAGRLTAATEPSAIQYQSEATHPAEPQTY